MRRHAILWCGYAKPDSPWHSDAKRESRARERSEVFDFRISVNDLDIACRGARALDIAPSDIHAFVCRDDLLPADFRGRYHPATRTALSSVLRELPAEDALLLVATNHGERGGLLTAEVPDEFDEDLSARLLSPRELGLALDGRSGVQVLIIAACHAGIFLELGNESRTVIAACGADEKYFAGGDPPGSPLLQEFVTAWTGTTFNDLPAPQRHPDLTSAFEAAKKGLAGSYPGHTITVPHIKGDGAWPESDA